MPSNRRSLGLARDFILAMGGAVQHTPRDDKAAHAILAAGGESMPPCASCQRPLSEHGEPHEWDSERRPSCPPPSLTGTYRATPSGGPRHA